MQVNNKKIVGIFDVLSILIQNRFKKLGKQPLFKVFKDILLLDPTYQPINISKRVFTIFLSTNLDINLLSLFFIFLFISNCNLIFIYININAKVK